MDKKFWIGNQASVIPVDISFASSFAWVDERCLILAFDKDEANELRLRYYKENIKPKHVEIKGQLVKVLSENTLDFYH